MARVPRLVRYTLAMSDATSSAVPAWSVRLAAELDATDHTAQELAAGLTTEQLNWQPAPGKWSIGQCLEHLCITNEAYIPAIRDSLTGKSARRFQESVPEIAPGWMARWFIRNYIEPSAQSKRAGAPKKIAPAARVELSVVDRFLHSNLAIRDLVRQAAGYDVNRIRFWNPFLPGIRFTAGTGLQLMAGHERRHLLQAERVKASGEFPW